MYRVTNKKTGEVYNCESLDEAKSLVRFCVIDNNFKKKYCDRKTNYIIKEV